MTQSVLMYGPPGQQVSAVGPDGPVNMVLGSAPAGQAALYQFNTITAGAAGTNRMADLPIATFLALPTGTLAYTGNNSATVPSVHALWRRMTTPTAVSSDSITVFKPLGGASREVWVRVLTFGDVYWQQRLVGTVVVDPAGSDENFGNLAAPLLTEAEAARRLGILLAPGTFVFQPGGGFSGQGNVFNDWTQLYAAAILSPAPRVIAFDDSFGAISIPAGTYDLGKACTFQAVQPNATGALSNRVTVACPDGVVFTTPINVIRDVTINYSGTHSLMPIPNDGAFWHVFLQGWARLTCSGAAGSIFSPAGAASICVVTLADYGTFTVSGGGFIFDWTGGTAGFEVDAVGWAVISNVVPANCLKGPAGPAYTFVAQALSQIVTTQAAMPGGVITPIIEFGAGRNLSYTPSTGANWVDPDPTTVNGALDRIAAAVVAGAAGPIA